MEDLSNKFNELSVAPKVNTNDEVIKVGNNKKIIIPKIIIHKLPPKQEIVYPKGLGKNTILLMFDGTSRSIFEIKANDQLMGPDSLPRTVLSISEDIGKLHEIVPNKGAHIFCTNNHKFVAIGIEPYVSFMKYQCKKYAVISSKNGKEKALSFFTKEEAEKYRLNVAKQKDIFNISIDEYFGSTKSLKHHTYTYHCGLNFIEREIPIDPYMIGFWLGDGSSSGTKITNIDEECLDYFRNNLGQYNLELVRRGEDITYGIRTIGKSSPGSNKFFTTLQDLNMLNNKHIPDIYKMNSRDVRLKVLAGLIDSDGHNGGNYIEIFQKNKKLSDDIEFLCFSLGFMITRVECQKGCMYEGEMKYGIYQRMNIFGEGMEEIPIILDRKKMKERGINKRATCSGFKISEQTTEASCFNIQISGDHRFLLRDFAIMHDSS